MWGFYICIVFDVQIPHIKILHQNSFAIIIVIIIILPDLLLGYCWSTDA